MIRTTFKTQLTDVQTTGSTATDANPTATARDVVGSLRFENDKWYKYVKLINDTASVTVAGAIGDPCCYKAITGFAASQVCLDNSSADATDPIVAGFLAGVVTGTYNVTYYCWIQLTGYVSVPTIVGGTPVIGSGVMMTSGGGSDKTLTKVTGVIRPCGILLTTAATPSLVLADCIR